MREIWEHDQALVGAFVEENLPRLSLESLRIALKHAPKEVRDTYVSRLKEA